MVKELEVVNIIPRILSIGEIAKELFKEINKISDNEIILNFKGVEYMCVVTVRSSVDITFHIF